MESGETAPTAQRERSTASVPFDLEREASGARAA
jgi:hypothetical protein